MKIMTHQEFLDEATKRFGEDAKNWRFVCPACGTVQSMQDFEKAGAKPEEIEGAIAFCCVGRYTGQGDKGIAAKNRGKKWDKGCNWTLGGLFRIHTLEIEFDGKKRPTFELAEV